MGGGGWQYPSPRRPFPMPKQQRGAETVRAAVGATVELLERLPVHEVTFKAIRARSGVSQGSLTHHFGSRDGLIATAHVARYERSCAADAAFLARYAGALSSAEEFATAMLDHVGEMLSEERREVRWIRMSAIGAAFGDEELSATLSAAYTTLADGLTRYADEARHNGLVQADADPRSIALLLSMHAQGLVLDDLIQHDVPVATWHHLMVRFVSSFLTPAAAVELERQASRRLGDMWRAEVFGTAGRVPGGVADRLRALREEQVEAGTSAAVPADPDEADEVHAVRRLLERAERAQEGLAPRRARFEAQSRTSAHVARERMLALGARALRAHGDAGVDVAELREATATSPQAFHRMFGGREAFVRELRIRLEIARAAHSTVRFARIVAGSSSAADMRRALELGAVAMAEVDARMAMWQRMETLAVARTDTELRTTLARVQRVARDLLVEQVCLAQSRQLMDPGLPARSVARLLDGTVFWHVFHGLDARRPAREDWVAMLRRIANLLSPDAPGSC